MIREGKYKASLAATDTLERPLPLLIKTHTQIQCVKGLRTALEGSFHPMSCHIRAMFPLPSASHVVTVPETAEELVFGRFFFSGCGC